MPKAALIDAFREHGNAILVGSMSFWEGVDVQGEALSLVVIDKLPFAPPDDPVYAARSDALREQGKSPFALMALPEAVTALKQGSGRLIRSETDRGVFMLCDSRVADKAYGRTILKSLPDFSVRAVWKRRWNSSAVRKRGIRRSIVNSRWRRRGQSVPARSPQDTSGCGQRFF